MNYLGQIYIMRCNNYCYVGKHDGDIYKDNYYGSGIIWRNIINKYGKENVDREVIDHYSTKQEADILEKKWISLFKNNEKINCVNIADGGQGGNLGEEVNKKLRGRIPWNKNIPMSEEAKQKASKSLKGHPNYNHSNWHPSEEIKRKISKGHIGIKQTEEAIKKIREARKNQKNLKLDSQKGKHWYTNGIDNIICFEHEKPNGYERGRTIIKRRANI